MEYGWNGMEYAMEYCTFVARRAIDFVDIMPTCLGAHNSVIFLPTEKYNISKYMYFWRWRQWWKYFISISQSCVVKKQIKHFALFLMQEAIWQPVFHSQSLWWVSCHLDDLNRIFIVVHRYGEEPILLYTRHHEVDFATSFLQQLITSPVLFLDCHTFLSLVADFKTKMIRYLLAIKFTKYYVSKVFRTMSCKFLQWWNRSAHIIYICT